jgi:hypothetical protein
MDDFRKLQAQLRSRLADLEEVRKEVRQMEAKVRGHLKELFLNSGILQQVWWRRDEAADNHGGAVTLLLHDPHVDYQKVLTTWDTIEGRHLTSDDVLYLHGKPHTWKAVYLHWKKWQGWTPNSPYDSFCNEDLRLYFSSKKLFRQFSKKYELLLVGEEPEVENPISLCNSPEIQKCLDKIFSPQAKIDLSKLPVPEEGVA